MSKETGIQKNLGNFETLITHCESYNGKYNPGNPAITLDNLKSFLKQVGDAVSAEIEAKKAFDHKTNARMTEFDGIGKLSTRIMNALIGSGASRLKIDDAAFHHRNLNGRRASSSIPDNEKNESEKTGSVPDGATGNEKDKAYNRHSVSQQGYDNLIGHFEKLLKTLATEPAYNPNELELSLDGLNKKLERMTAKNESLKKAESAWVQSLIARNESFNQDGTGMIAIAILVKAYIKSVYTANSQQFKHVSDLKLKKIKER